MKKCVLLLMAINLFLLSQSQPESPWLISGNSGTIPGIHFLGTTDNKPLGFRVNNVYAGEIDSLRSKAFFGFGAGSHVTTGTGNAAIGFKALYSNTTGSYNTASGTGALYSNINGTHNTATGYFALYYNVAGFQNTATGYYALYRNVGSYNTATGRSALVNNTTGHHNTATGYQSLGENTTGFDNTATGINALLGNTTGSYNTADGEGALYVNTTGQFNTATGHLAIANNYGGNNNTAMGFAALFNTVSASNNTAIGYRAADTNNLGWNNTIIGANNKVNGTGYYNCVALGESVTCTAPSQARIGNTSTVSVGGYVGWSNFSDGRYKKDIKEEVKGLDFIMKLRPVTYHLDVAGLSKQLNEGGDKKKDEFTQKAIGDKEKILFSGFLAQEVEQAAKETGYDFSGVDKPKNENDFYGLRYAEFVVPLVKAMQQQQQMINELKKQNDRLNSLNADQKKLNEDLLERIKRLESSFVTKK